MATWYPEPPKQKDCEASVVLVELPKDPNTTSLRNIPRMTGALILRFKAYSCIKGCCLQEREASAPPPHSGFAAKVFADPYAREQLTALYVI